MDHSNVDVNVKQENSSEANFDYHITEDGKQYTVPYRIIKEVTFTNLKKEELIDIPHAARLQYRLMLMDPIIKARIDFTKLRMIVIYNPRTANNMKEKISLDEIKEFLAKQGVNVSSEYTSERDYDYKKELYDYAHDPKSIRERSPYGYSMEEWKTMKPEWETKMKEAEVEKKIKFRKFQEDYMNTNPEVVEKVEPGYKPKEDVVKKTFFGKIFKKKAQKEKGFWFHGI